MCGPGNIGVVTFLNDEKALNGVDELFRELVVDFHKIPHCATFGVSCAGHLYLEDGDHQPCSEAEAVHFCPQKLGGNLNILVQIELPHIQELLAKIQLTVGQHTDASFRRILHLFGPGNHGRLDVWEIRIGDNDALGDFGIGSNAGKYAWRYPVEEQPQLFADTRQRISEVEAFWAQISQVVAEFCQQHGFSKFDLEARVNELGSVREQDLQELENGAVPEFTTQHWECLACDTRGCVDHPTKESPTAVWRKTVEAHKQVSPGCKHGHHLLVPRLS